MSAKMRKIVLAVCIFGMYCMSNALGEELLPVQASGKWGYMNNSAAMIIPAQWDYAAYFRASKIALVGKKQANGELLYGLIDKNGNYILPCAYYISEGESESFFGGEDGYYLVQNPERTLCGYYDIQNEFFCEPIYLHVDIWDKNDENIISVTKADGYTVYIHALTGEQISQHHYFETFPWHENAALCRADDGTNWIQFIDGSRKQIPQEYDVRSDIHHGLFIVANRNFKYSLMNLQAEIVTPWYDYIEVTSNGLFYSEDASDSGIVYVEMKLNN